MLDGHIVAIIAAIFHGQRTVATYGDEKAIEHDVELAARILNAALRRTGAIP